MGAPWESCTFMFGGLISLPNQYVRYSDVINFIVVTCRHVRDILNMNEKNAEI